MKTERKQVMKRETRSKTLNYTIPADAKEFGWMAFVLWRDPKDGHRHATVPWEVAVDISPEDRRTLHRLDRAIVKCIWRLSKDERARQSRRIDGGGILRKENAK